MEERKDPHLPDLPYAMSSLSKRDVRQNSSQGSCRTVVGWAVEKCLTPDQLVEQPACVSWPVKPHSCSPGPYKGLDVSWPTSKLDKDVERYGWEKREEKGHKDVVVED